MTIWVILALALWALGGWRGAPLWQRWVLVGGLAVLAGLGWFILPAGHPLRIAPGDWRVWLVIAGALALAVGYRNLLRRLKAKALPVVAAPVGRFSAEELERYARHILLREIGGPGQGRLKKAKVLVVGAGGLGSPAILYLAAAGVGCIGVVDDDVVEASNLQRQIMHTDQRLGMPKVQSALEAVKALNRFVELRPYQRRLDEDSVGLIAEYDLILDGSDNFDTRYLVNRACVAAGKPLISAAITQWEGQISVYDSAGGTPCYECVFPVRPAPGMVPTCAEAGVAAPLPGVIGSMMAMEAVKYLTGAGEPLIGRLMIHDALYAETRVIGVKKRADCPVCGGALTPAARLG